MMQSRRKHRRIIVSAPKRDNCRGSDHHKHESNEGRKDEDPDWQAVLHRVGVAPRVTSA
jgi:hypothetical protein